MFDGLFLSPGVGERSSRFCETNSRNSPALGFVLIDLVSRVQSSAVPVSLIRRHPKELAPFTARANSPGDFQSILTMWIRRIADVDLQYRFNCDFLSRHAIMSE